MGNRSFQTQPQIYLYYFELSIRPITFYVFMIRQTPCNIELSAQFINLAHNDGQ